MSINRGVDKDDVENMHNGYYSAIKRNEIMVFAATWMDLEIIMLSDISQTMRHQHQMLSLTCGIWKKDTMNFFAEQILTQQTLKNVWFPKETVREVGGVLGLWDGKPMKLDCDDHCTTINVINSLSNNKKVYCFWMETCGFELSVSFLFCFLLL